MSKVITFILILIFSITLFGAEVKNEDKPLKGSWDFSPQKLWEVDGGGSDPFVRVAQIRVDDDGTVYLLEAKHSKLYVFGPDGKFRFSFGKKGEGPGEYRFAFTFSIIDKYVIIPSMGRLHYFDKKDGKFVRTEILPTMRMMPRLFLDKDRFILIPTDPEQKSGKDTLLLYDIKTKKRDTVLEIESEQPMQLSSDRGGRRMLVMIIDPTTNPGVVLAYKNNKLYFGKSDHYKIRAADLEGKELLSFSLEGRERRKISEAFKKKRVGGFRLNNARLPPDMAKQMMKSIPDYATYFSGLMVDDKGYIYVFVTDLEKENSQEIDIFSPEGKYLYHSEITFPRGSGISSGPILKGDHLYVVLEDESGALQLAKYKINTI
jgi:outer membrane protein assembly factor BamB